MILLPTLNRTKLLERFLLSYKATKATVPGVILVDSADYTKNEIAYDTIKQNLPENWMFRLTQNSISMGDKVRYWWMDKSPDLKWVGVLNDDHVCITPEWDKKMESLLDGTNMVSCNDGNWMFGCRVVGLTAWSMPLLEAVGFPIFPRNLQHLYIDDVWKAIGESAGCWLETNKVNIEHRHAFSGKMDQDDTFKKVYAQPSWEYDAKEFKHFMEQDFKAVCEKVHALRSRQNHLEKFT